MRRQEMDTEECVRFLQNKAWQFDPENVERIVNYIVKNKSPEVIRWYSFCSDEQIHDLFVEAMSSTVTNAQQSQQSPGQQPPSWEHSLPFAHWKRHFDPSGSLRGFQAPSHPIGPIGPQQQQRFDPVGNSQGIQAPSPPIGPTGTSQSPISVVTSLREHFPSLSKPSDAMTSIHRNASKNVTECPASSSKVQTKRCEYHFNWGFCKKGGDCPDLHEFAGVPQRKKSPIHSLQTLPTLETEIEAILSLQKSSIPIELLPKLYFEKYAVPLLVKGIGPEGQEEGQASYSLRSLLMRLNTIKVIERDGKHYVVPVRDACELGEPADDSKLVLAPPSSGSNMIFIAFYRSKRFTFKDAMDYFSKYGPVNYVQMQPGKTYGFVSFVYPETVKLVLSERNQEKRHYICKDPVIIEPYKGKHERG